MGEKRILQAFGFLIARPGMGRQDDVQVTKRFHPALSRAFAGLLSYLATAS
jgi:hypothetical protein